MWNDTLQLVKTTLSPDDEGIERETTEKAEVYCSRQSVGMNEFYQSSLNGEEIKIVFLVRECDYNEQPYAEYNGKVYKIVRTYTTKNECIELHCSIKEGISS